jgi:hypothetical protein
MRLLESLEEDHVQRPLECREQQERVPQIVHHLRGCGRAPLRTPHGYAYGEPYAMDNGLPLSELRASEAEAAGKSWYSHAVDYVDRRWNHAAPNSRRSVAETLTNATMALLDSSGGEPATELLREALYGWAFDKRRRLEEEPPDEIGAVLAWVERHSRPMAALSDHTIVLDVLDAIARKQDGKKAAANTVARKRAVLHNVLEYGVGRGLAGD